MYTCLMFNAAVAIYALVRLLTDSRATRPIGSQFREYLHAWRTLGPVEPDTEGTFSYRDETTNQTGWRAWIFRHRWLPIQTIETDLAWVAFIVFSAATLLRAMDQNFSTDAAILREFYEVEKVSRKKTEPEAKYAERLRGAYAVGDILDEASGDLGGISQLGQQAVDDRREHLRGGLVPPALRPQLVIGTHPQAMQGATASGSNQATR